MDPWGSSTLSSSLLLVEHPVFGMHRDLKFPSSGRASGSLLTNMASCDRSSRPSEAPWSDTFASATSSICRWPGLLPAMLTVKYLQDLPVMCPL